MAVGSTGLSPWTKSRREHNDEAGHEFCHPLYVALLNDLKQSLE
jgi:hypothetical protein